ncbi:hypothetical protein [Mucilaginibacter sp.]
MRTIAHYLKSSFDGGVTEAAPAAPVNPTDPPAQQKAWRPKKSSVTCVLDANQKNTGYAHVGILEEFYSVSQEPTGLVKDNVPSDVNYYPDYLDANTCPVYVSPAPDSTAKLFTNGQTSAQVHLNDATNNHVYDLNGTTQTAEIYSGTYSIRVVPANQQNGQCRIKVNDLAEVVCPANQTRYFPNVASPISVTIYPV